MTIFVYHSMKKILAAGGALLLLLVPESCASVPGLPVLSHAERIGDFVPQWQELTEGIAVTAGKIVRPRLEFWAARVDLMNKNIEIVVNNAETGGGLPAGTIPAVTVSGFAARYGCVAAMNAGPFSPVSDKSGEPRVLTGIFISNGVTVSPPVSRYDCLVFYDDGRAAVLPQAELTTDRGVRHALGGFFTVLDGARPVERGPQSGNIRHPRRPLPARG